MHWFRVCITAVVSDSGLRVWVSRLDGSGGAESLHRFRRAEDIEAARVVVHGLSVERLCVCVRVYVRVRVHVRSCC